MHLVFEILTDRGRERFDTFRAHRAAEEQSVRFTEARVIDPQTQTVERAEFAGSRQRAMLARLGLIDLPSVEVGDHVEIAYEVEDLSRTWFGDYYGEAHTLAHGSSTTLFSELTLMVQEDIPLKTHVRKGSYEVAQLEEERSEGSRILTFRARNLLAVSGEPLMPAWREILPSIEFTTYESWDEFTGWWWNLIAQQQRSSEEMKAKVSELTEGVESDLEKIRRIYEFVANEIDYEAWEFGVHGYKPYDAPTIFSRRHGDCKDKSIVLNAMLAEVGITSYPVLIRAEEERSEEDLTLARVGQFKPLHQLRSRRR